MIDFTFVFWVATVTFFISSLLILFTSRTPLSGLFYIQFLAGSILFASSKIGREFLGLE